MRRLARWLGYALALFALVVAALGQLLEEMDEEDDDA